MSEQARKVFNIEEQRAKDILAAIKTISPVIPLIREWGIAEQQLLPVKEEEKKLKEEIELIKNTINLLEDRVIALLAKEHNKRCRAYSEIYEKCEELKQKCKFYESQVIYYREYAELFSWVDIKDLKKLLDLNYFQDKDEFLSMVFLALNNNNNKSPTLGEWQSLEKSLKISIKDVGSIFLNGWNYMLKKLKANEL